MDRNNKTYIIVFKDGCMAIMNNKPRQGDFNPDLVTKIFSTNDTTPIIEVCELQARCFKHPKVFKEEDIKS